MRNSEHLVYSARFSFVASVLIVALVLFSFLAFEPTMSRAASVTSNSFTVTQQITTEISFRVQPSNVAMNGSIAGLTGGYATGTTSVVVNTNNATGYTMTLFFATTSGRQSSMAASSTAYIGDYTPAVAGVPDFTWVDNSAGQSSEFGYTVRASTTGEVDPSFRNNGSACNTSTSETNDRCWLNPTTTPETIINSGAPNGGSTTTIKFRVSVPSSPSPALPSGFYVATGTLTAVTN